MQLFVGLGNPGPKYARHRHNVGFMAVEAIADRHGFPAWRKRLRGHVSEGRLDGERVALLRPETFMNESGRAVAAAMQAYRIGLADVVVFHDELDLPGGRLRVKRGGGSAGHNGLRSIDRLLGPGYLRVRIGIGHPGERSRVTGHVLRAFGDEDRGWLVRLLDAIARAAPLLARGDEANFMNRVALLARPPEGDVEVGFNCGIVGLPNVGKSTLFNALTSGGAAAANYPFCTVEPNVGQVAVPDPRLAEIARLAGSARTVPTFLEFVDIAGLVEGASRGEGLGNRFLGHVREVDAIAHVLRCFDDGEISHVAGSVDPLRDAETVETELMLADLESLEGRLDLARKRGAAGDRDQKRLALAMAAAVEALSDGRPARAVREERPDLRETLDGLQLLTTKPVLYVCNVGEAEAATGNAHSEAVAARAAREGAGSVVVSAAIEAEIAALGDAGERAEFVETLGLAETGLDRFIRAGHDLLGLIVFFTAGPKEARAWTVERGAKAPEAAGRIHGDFERGFIRAETVSCEDYLACGGERGAREAGRMRAEGRDYVVRDGDVMLFRFNV